MREHIGSSSINLKLLLSSQTPDSHQVLSDVQQRTFAEAGGPSPVVTDGPVCSQNPVFSSMFSGIPHRFHSSQILQCHQTCTVGLWSCFAATDVLEGHISSVIIKQEREGSLNLSMAQKNKNKQKKKKKNMGLVVLPKRSTLSWKQT